MRTHDRPGVVSGGRYSGTARVVWRGQTGLRVSSPKLITSVEASIQSLGCHAWDANYHLKGLAGISAAARNQGCLMSEPDAARQYTNN